jgi:CMP-N-acetylneuraminic acid synthetase
LVVSTDNDDIAHISRKAGAEVIYRPSDIVGDTASSESALLHVINRLAEQEDYHPDLIVFLQCTSPLAHVDDIDGTIQCLLQESADTAIAVSNFHYFIWRQAQGNASGINHEKNVRLLRQEREPQYIESGSVYVMRAEGFKMAKHRFFGKTVMHDIPAERCWEIDEPIDFSIAEIMLRKHLSGQRKNFLSSPVAAVIFDFDGAFTDNTVLVSPDGREAVRCNRSDGWGLARLREIGLPIIVL